MWPSYVAVTTPWRRGSPTALTSVHPSVENQGFLNMPRGETQDFLSPYAVNHPVHRTPIEDLPLTGMRSVPAGWHADAFSLVERVWSEAHVPSPPSTEEPERAPSGYQPPPGLKNELFKTEMCRSFVATGGFCRYGPKCQFAHGMHELRPVRRHPRYKTKHCRNWINHGTCPYGARCRFIHAQSSRGSSPTNTARREDGDDSWNLHSAQRPEISQTFSSSPLNSTNPLFTPNVEVQTYSSAVPYSNISTPGSAFEPPSSAPAAVSAAYDPGTHGPLSNFTRELLAELPPARRLSAFSDIAGDSGHAPSVSGKDIFQLDADGSDVSLHVPSRG